MADKLYSVHEDCALCYASCNRCTNYIDESSSLFGELFCCQIENHPDNVYDNDWHFMMGEPIIDCEHFKLGNPTNSLDRITVGTKVRLKKHINHICPDGRIDNLEAEVSRFLGDGKLFFSEDLRGCQWWHIDDVEKVAL